MNTCLDYILFGPVTEDYVPLYHRLDTYTRVQLLSTCKHLRAIVEITRPFGDEGGLEGSEGIVRITNTEWQRVDNTEDDHVQNIFNINISNNNPSGFGSVIIGYGVSHNTNRSYVMSMPCHLTLNSNTEPIQLIGKKNEIRASSYSYLGNITVIGSCNIIIVNDFVVCKNVTIIGNNCKIVFNGFVKRYANLEIIKTGETVVL